MSIYTQTARFDTGRALGEDELRKLAPSIFAVAAHESRSERFRPIPTYDLVKALAKEGFSVVGAKQGNSRVPGKADFTKHLLRLRRLDDDQKHNVGGTVCEMLLKNANDGTSQYELMAGLFRIQCLNSLVTQTDTLESVKVRHSGNEKKVVDDVIDGTYSVIETATKYLQAPAEWSKVQLTQREAQAFANAAHEIRFADAEGVIDTPIRPAQLLEPARREDTSPDLWTIANVIQERCIRGGLSAQRPWENGRPGRRITTKGIKNIDGDLRINRALWRLNEEMAAIKGCSPIEV